MYYMNRQMVADRAFRHEGQELLPGDRFYATPVDAEYLCRHKKAHDAPERVATVVAADPAPAAQDEAKLPDGEQGEPAETAPPEVESSAAPAAAPARRRSPARKTTTGRRRAQ